MAILSGMLATVGYDSNSRDVRNIRNKYRRRARQLGGKAETAESLTSRNSKDVDNSSIGLTAAQETTATSGDSRTDERSQ